MRGIALVLVLCMGVVLGMESSSLEMTALGNMEDMFLGRYRRDLIRCALDHYREFSSTWYDART